MHYRVLILVAALVIPTFNVSTHAESTVPPIAMAEEGHKHGEGEKHKLGRQKIGDYTVSVIMIGEAKPGEEVEFDIKLIDATTDSKALRVWIGTEDGNGSEKADAEKGKTTYDVHVKVPNPLPEGAKVWVEIETEGGKSSGSYAIEDKHDHKH